ncbi:unnamed protein product [Pleuronectes platessa]|uniref:Uncharacterized protein n=1 Tax=Pleuronectes platessa TaxID=8262 RepID=A0A9N7YD80_PLEPL|nr:unnamed protein product [Pleuronectes platessa]
MRSVLRGEPKAVPSPLEVSTPLATSPAGTSACDLWLVYRLPVREIYLKRPHSLDEFSRKTLGGDCGPFVRRQDVSVNDSSSELHRCKHEASSSVSDPIGTHRSPTTP